MGLATLTSESHTGFQKVECVIASQKNELATRLEEVENVMESHKLSLATLTSESNTRVPEGRTCHCLAQE